MHLRTLLTIAFSISCLTSISAQGAHDLLIQLTGDKASSISEKLGLTGDAPDKLKNVYVRYAIAVEDLVVNAEPDVAIMKKVEFLESSRDAMVATILDEEQAEVYWHILAEMEKQEQSEFDSLQIYLANDSFSMATAQYYDDHVAPYVLFYHQTYFKPALKQKHMWKINQSRAEIRTHSSEMDSTAAVNVDKTINTLKKIRKRYKDQLDYITVALGPMEREWTMDYIKMVQAHFDDETYQKIADHTWSMNAYGMHYIVGELSMVLLDIWEPRSYIENREVLLGLFTEELN